MTVEPKDFDVKLLAAGGMNEVETFYGLVETTADALRIVELCRQGKLGRVSRRLHDKERKMIRSGSVFVFDELESGIKRWTDGRIWSPSRILGNFLIYRELERKGGGAGEGPLDANLLCSAVEKDLFCDEFSSGSSPQRDPELASILPWLNDQLEEEDEEGDQQLEVLQSKKLLTNHKGQYSFKPGGLIKKTISIKIDGHPHHLVCYYNKRDFCCGHLGRGGGEVADLAIGGSPFNYDLMESIRKIRLSPELLAQQSFRKQLSIAQADSEGFDVIESVGPTPDLKKPTPKRRSSFPGATPAVRLKYQQQRQKPPGFFYVPIAPATDSTTSIIESILNSNVALLETGGPEEVEFMKAIGADEPVSKFEEYETYVPPPEVDQSPQDEDELNTGLKWDNWLTSPVMQSDEEQQRAASAMTAGDPIMSSVRPPSLVFNVTPTSPTTSFFDCE